MKAKSKKCNEQYIASGGKGKEKEVPISSRVDFTDRKDGTYLLAFGDGNGTRHATGRICQTHLVQMPRIAAHLASEATTISRRQAKLNACHLLLHTARCIVEETTGNKAAHAAIVRAHEQLRRMERKGGQH